MKANDGIHTLADILLNSVLPPNPRRHRASRQPGASCPLGFCVFTEGIANQRADAELAQLAIPSVITQAACLTDLMLLLRLRIPPYH